MSKGSNPRPLSVPRDQFGGKWDAIFQCKCQPGKCEKVKNCRDAKEKEK